MNTNETTKEFVWPFEISGFGGEYENACRKMTKAGVLWLRKHPQELEKWRKASREYRERTGKEYTPPNAWPASYDDFEAAMLKPCNDCTGAMFGASKSHAIAIFEKGWEVYCNEVLEARSKEDK